MTKYPSDAVGKWYVTRAREPPPSPRSAAARVEEWGFAGHSTRAIDASPIVVVSLPSFCIHSLASMALPYWGGKARIAEQIGSAILADADPSKQEYWEPFAGMASVARVCAPKRKWKRVLLNDKDARVAEYLDALCNSNWEPETRAYPTLFEWQQWKAAPSDVNNTFYGLLLGYAGHMFSGSKPNTPRIRRYDSLSASFDCTIQNKLVALNKFRAAFNDVPVTCTSVPFHELSAPSNAIVYCDPPYIASQAGRSMNVEQQKKLEAFCKSCLQNKCDVYMSNNAIPEFKDASLTCTVLKSWQNFRNQTGSMHKSSHGRTEMLMKVITCTPPLSEKE